MRRISEKILWLLLAAAAAALLFPGPAAAEEIKAVGVIAKIDIAGPDALTATATLTVDETNETLTVVVNDEETLDKFKDHRIVEGDEVRVKYEVRDGKNVSTFFRKTAGC